MTGTSTPRTYRLFTICITIVGALTVAAAVVAFVIGWESADAEPWRTAFWICGALCAVLGIGFAIVGAVRR